MLTKEDAIALLIRESASLLHVDDQYDMKHGKTMRAGTNSLPGNIYVLNFFVGRPKLRKFIYFLTQNFMT